MPNSPTTASQGTEAERVAAVPRGGTEHTRDRPVYLPRVDIIETEDALEIVVDMPGVTRDSVEVTLEQGAPPPGVRGRRLRAGLRPVRRG